MSVTAIAAVLSAALTGLLAGGLMFGAWVLGPAERREDDSFYVRLHQVMNRTADPFMPILATAALVANLLLLALLIGTPDHVAVPLAAGAALGTAAGIVSSVRVNVPLNQRIDAWSVSPLPPELDEVRRRWGRYHLFRTVSTLVGFGAALAAAAVMP